LPDTCRYSEIGAAPSSRATRPIDLEEADRLAGQIAVLDGGRLVAEGTAAELKRRVGTARLDLTCVSAAAWSQVVRCCGDRAVHLDQASLTVGVPTDGSAAQVRALLDETDPGRSLIASFAVREATLDDVFLTLTGPEGDHPCLTP